MATITQEFADRINELRMQYMMFGQEPPYPEAFVGSDAQEYLTQLFYVDGRLATELSDQLGVAPADLHAGVEEIERRVQEERSNSHGLVGDLFRGVGEVGEFVHENPLVPFLLPLAIGGALGAFGGGSAATGGAAATDAAAGAAAGGGAATTFPLTTTGLVGGPVTVSAIPGVTSAAGLASLGAGAAAAVPGDLGDLISDGMGPGAGAIPAGGGMPASTVATTALPAATGGGGGGGPMLTSDGIPIPGTEPPAGGGGLGDLLGGLFGGGGVETWGPLIGGLLGALDANNQPDSMTTNQGGTSTSTYGQTLPTQITGPANDALNAIRAMFTAGAPVAGVNPATTSAVSRLQNLRTNPFATGGPQNNAPVASGFANGSIVNSAPTTSAFASGATINPYLDSVFNTAANALQPRLATEFAHAGRFGSDSHQQARSQELQTLAASIYGPGFEAERGRQYGAAESGVDRTLAQTEGNLGRQFGAQESALTRLLAQIESNLGRQYGAIEGDLGRELSSALPLLAAGDSMREVEQQQLDAPTTNLLRYLSQLQGMLPFFPGTQTQSTEQTGSVTNPLFNNPLAGFLGGAQLGSLFGRA